jgi:hypothetical protein
MDHGLCYNGLHLLAFSIKSVPSTELHPDKDIYGSPCSLFMWDPSILQPLRMPVSAAFNVASINTAQSACDVSNY